MPTFIKLKNSLRLFVDIIIKVIHLLLLISLLPLNYVLAEPEKKNNIIEHKAGSQQSDDPVLGNALSVSYWVYSKDFAERFSLQAPDIDLLEKDIFAIELRFYKSPYTVAPYHCTFNVFYDSKIKLDFPESVTSDVRSLYLEDQMPKGAKMSRIEDRKYIGNKMGDYYIAGSLQRLHEGKWFRKSISLNQYRENYLPDMSWASYEVVCGIVGQSLYSTDTDWYLSIGSNANKPEVKSGAPKHSVEKLRIKIPAQLMRNFTDPAQKASHQNGIIVDNYRKARGLK